eukprot:4506244-Alexandrium_andersonii.AAC.1
MRPGRSLAVLPKPPLEGGAAPQPSGRANTMAAPLLQRHEERRPFLGHGFTVLPELLQDRA